MPILLVLTFAWVLYLAGCFGSEDPDLSVDTAEPTAVIPTSTPPPVVTDSTAPLLSTEEPFVHVIEEGDLLESIATKYNVPSAVILRANPELNPNVLIVGRTLRIPGASTVNTVDIDRDAAREAGEQIDYVIEAGDTLGAISSTFTVSLSALAEANPNISPDNLQIGDLIVIPPFGTGYSPDELAAFSTPVPVVRQPGEILEHEVAPGDSLSALASLYSVTIDQIMATNSMGDPDDLIVGDVLMIPPPRTGNDG